jgi:hypothetical protein
MVNDGKRNRDIARGQKRYYTHQPPLKMRVFLFSDAHMIDMWLQPTQSP